MDLKNVPIGSVIEAWAKKTPDALAATFVSIAADGDFEDETLTWSTLDHKAKAFAGWMESVGLKKGDRIAIMLQNHPEFLEAMIAASYLGVVFVPIDPRSTGDKLVYMLDFTDCQAVIVGDYAEQLVRDVEHRLGKLRHVLVVGTPSKGSGAFATLFAYADAVATGTNFSEPAAIDTSDTMFMMFTSGTTGNPKAVVRDHASHIRDFHLLLNLGIDPSYRLYTGLPLCHINAQFIMNIAMRRGQHMVFSRKFTKSRMLDVCRAYDCQTFSLLGGMTPEFFSNPLKPDDKDNPVKLIISSGMPTALWDGYRERYGVQITELYGSTEGGGVLINRHTEGPIGSMGRPPKGMVAEILDENDTPLPDGTKGHICFRYIDRAAEPVIYLKNEKASAEKVSNGWFRSGDIATRDADGWYWFHHREGGGVRRNGEFVNTFLVESVLSKHDGVADIFVYGAATPETVAGEKTLIAAVVLESGADTDDIAAWAQGALQKNEVPAVWQVLDEIPKTISEKPVERLCIDLLRDSGLVEIAQ